MFFLLKYSLCYRLYDHFFPHFCVFYLLSSSENTDENFSRSRKKASFSSSVNCSMLRYSASLILGNGINLFLCAPKASYIFFDNGDFLNLKYIHTSMLLLFCIYAMISV